MSIRKSPRKAENLPIANVEGAPEPFEFQKGDVVTITITGRIYSVNREGKHVFYGVEWQNARKLPVRTLHDGYQLKK